MNSKAAIQAYYHGTGNNARDTIEHVKGLKHSGYAISYDGSLAVFYFPVVVLVIGDHGLTFIEVKI